MVCTLVCGFTAGVRTQLCTIGTFNIIARTRTFLDCRAARLAQRGRFQTTRAPARRPRVKRVQQGNLPPGSARYDAEIARWVLCQQ
jgi:hypothetical protein